MGYQLSCHRPQCDLGPRHLKGRKRQKGPHLNATCSFAHSLAAYHQVNVNTATEEELMTLQGINRTLAHNIVLYRHKIGGFRKIEDMALVTGVGATTLQLIRPEICVSSRESSQSLENLSSFDLLSSTKLNINIAPEKELMASLGITEDLACCIVCHRTVHGPFKHIDDLLQVTGMDTLLLGTIRPKLTVTLPRPVSSYSYVQLEDRPKQILSYYSLQNLSLNSRVWDQPSLAQPAAEAFTGIFDGRQVVRIGTWNLQNLTLDKVNNPGVREVICLMLLENGIKLLAIQEVLHEDALDKICLELEKPTIVTVQEWKGDRGRWKYVVLDTSLGQGKQDVERVAFLWDTNSGLKLDRAVNLEKLLEQDNGHQPYSQPLLGRFKMGVLPLNLINVHLKAKQDSAVVSSIAHKSLQMDMLRTHLADQKQLIILGHFGLQPDAIEFNILRENHFEHCVPCDIFTNISCKNKNGDVTQDNIWWNQQLQTAYTGRWGVVRQGLSSPWIPDGWTWGGMVSHHCPVWMEFFID
ncbi:endonuclease/exonuclease/phosphatase family domain-containing protein 1-like isoform X1 [Carcharodon carcharias]|uniref:endonuclease/exonuclease/phosphatase family domain-containing protein 1-like isoform X1 n=1 Tax=Carcharodon carcharias TaxID=13397 RepID=UPI001B7E63B7|nr:endonuclease/exonuclease/phosphatase family domain-containing protein 1-like isoform X1 [Carcharodon carcharias]XP_041046773.1 endonuclease/exonuclease/phosphatase family domain-containing protein 1-like isoform X1 [Carcharodon carcharias]XP_041046774.1 endonuclease/exonuclease/phosphatase family domain-containing protein 1-like isoform X1 [Carcharodon carcharias]